MIIGTFLGGVNFGSMASRKRRAKTPQQIAVDACVKFKMDELGYSASDALASCKMNLQGVGDATVCAMRKPKWSARSPYGALVDINAFIARQIRP